MAVLKHIASKNANYSKTIQYLLFQHNEENNKPILDEYGRMMLREEYYMDGLLCEPMAFDQECEETNAYFHKNQNFDEIKSHHYIISFDPRDVTDHGLTGQQAQTLCLEFAKKYFPGHQALIVTHTDGHNQSGNIHTHIVINSVRKMDVKKQDFMERNSDARAGYKHHLSREYLKFLEKSVMEMCNREGLHQVDLLNPAPIKITQQEYSDNIAAYKEALDYLKARFPNQNFPPLKLLNSQKQELFTLYKQQKQLLQYYKKSAKELHVVDANINALLEIPRHTRKNTRHNLFL